MLDRFRQKLSLSWSRGRRMRKSRGGGRLGGEEGQRVGGEEGGRIGGGEDMVKLRLGWLVGAWEQDVSISANILIGLFRPLTNIKKSL